MTLKLDLDFLRDLEKEERKSLEEFKRKRSGGSNFAAPKLKFRRCVIQVLFIKIPFI